MPDNPLRAQARLRSVRAVAGSPGAAMKHQPAAQARLRPVLAVAGSPGAAMKHQPAAQARLRSVRAIAGSPGAAMKPQPAAQARLRSASDRPKVEALTSIPGRDTVGSCPASVPAGTAVFGTARLWFDSSVGYLICTICPWSVPDEHASPRSSWTRFNSWRGRLMDRLSWGILWGVHRQTQFAGLGSVAWLIS